MRIFVHDYCGHPFPVQLSRELAYRGHKVLHVYSGSYQTPHGALTKKNTDPQKFTIIPISLSKPFAKYKFIKRWRQTIEYGRLVAHEVLRFCPDVVLSANTPLEAQVRLIRASQACRARFVFWVQDIYGMAVYRILGRKWWYFGKAIGWYYLQLERSLLRKSDAVVLITDDFCPIMEEWGIDKTRIYVLPNWSPLTEIPIHPKQNPWAKKHGLENVLTMLYAGTLGMKHNPELLTQLALKFRDQSDIRIVVLSEGPGVDWLQQRKEELRLNNLVLMGFQPFEDFPQILASADLLLAILEPEAGIFSVPSKVLSYLCAQRPVLLAVPRENLAARIVETHNAGLVVSPNDPDSFLWAAECLLKDKSLREKMGKNARKYAEKHFAIDVITDRFESIFRFK